MANQLQPSDVALLDLLRKENGLSVAQLAQLMGVTATAVRQRLNRLMGQDFIERSDDRTAPRNAGPGRPQHCYGLTDKGRRQTGANFADLAVALWHEIRAIQDPEVRRGLIQRISRRLAQMYADQIDGTTSTAKMKSLARLFHDRNIPFSVEDEGKLPVLTALACPYPQLAEQDRSICAMERMLFSSVLGEGLRLTECRLDGAGCCTFEVN